VGSNRIKGRSAGPRGFGCLEGRKGVCFWRTDNLPKQLSGGYELTLGNKCSVGNGLQRGERRHIKERSVVARNSLIKGRRI